MSKDHWIKYEKYTKTLSTDTLKDWKQKRENKLLNPHTLRNRDEVERELEIINEVLEKRIK